MTFTEIVARSPVVVIRNVINRLPRDVVLPQLKWFAERRQQGFTRAIHPLEMNWFHGLSMGSVSDQCADFSAMVAAAPIEMDPEIAVTLDLIRLGKLSSLRKNVKDSILGLRNCESWLEGTQQSCEPKSR